MINLSEGLDPVVFLSVTHVQHAHTQMHLCAQDLLDFSQNEVTASVFFGGG